MLEKNQKRPTYEREATLTYFGSLLDSCARKEPKEGYERGDALTYFRSLSDSCARKEPKEA